LFFFCASFYSKGKAFKGIKSGGKKKEMTWTKRIRPRHAHFVLYVTYIDDLT
jgi:hypothetical protein